MVGAGSERAPRILARRARLAHRKRTTGGQGCCRTNPARCVHDSGRGGRGDAPLCVCDVLLLKRWEPAASAHRFVAPGLSPVTQSGQSRRRPAACNLATPRRFTLSHFGRLDNDPSVIIESDAETRAKLTRKCSHGPRCWAGAKPRPRLIEIAPCRPGQGAAVGLRASNEALRQWAPAYR